MVLATRIFLSDGFLAVLSTEGGVSDSILKRRMNRANRTEPKRVVKSTVTGPRSANGVFHWHWTLKPPKALKVSLACSTFQLWGSSCHTSQSAARRRQPFSPPYSLALHSSSAKISRSSTTHDIHQCEAIPVFLPRTSLRPTANTVRHQVTLPLPPSPKGARTGDSGKGGPCDEHEGGHCAQARRG